MTRCCFKSTAQSVLMNLFVENYSLDAPGLSFFLRVLFLFVGGSFWSSRCRSGHVRVLPEKGSCCD